MNKRIMVLEVDDAYFDEMESTGKAVFQIDSAQVDMEALTNYLTHLTYLSSLQKETTMGEERNQSLRVESGGDKVSKSSSGGNNQLQPEEDLPEGWEQYTVNENSHQFFGATYYHNKQKNISQWEYPIAGGRRKRRKTSRKRRKTRRKRRKTRRRRT